MALSGLAIYKMLPQTNCKECGYPTCLAFAMKLAARQVELSACPYVSDEAKAQLDSASAPPIRLISLGKDGHKLEVGNETVVFRHEKTFYHQPGLFFRLRDDMGEEEFARRLDQVANYQIERVGQTLRPDGVAIEDASGSADTFAARVAPGGGEGPGDHPHQLRTRRRWRPASRRRRAPARWSMPQVPSNWEDDGGPGQEARSSRWSSARRDGDLEALGDSGRPGGQAGRRGPGARSGHPGLGGLAERSDACAVRPSRRTSGRWVTPSSPSPARAQTAPRRRLCWRPSSSTSTPGFIVLDSFEPARFTRC